MDFDYEIVPSANRQYGAKLENGGLNKQFGKQFMASLSGTWTGVVGDLITGEIDISVATLTMTTEREEVIDFVAPYFDQSGISILLRKKEPKQSIFKFMTVLKPEVSIPSGNCHGGKEFQSPNWMSSSQKSLPPPLFRSPPCRN